MAPEKDKGFNFRKLFFRDIESNASGKQVQKADQPVSNIQDDFISNTPQRVTGEVQDQALVEDFVQRLQNLINQNNQPGFDFLEFTESLFEEKQNPTPDVYKTVFRIAQKIDKSLTPARLLESAMYYKNLVQQTADAEVDKGDSKKKGLQADKDNERNNLDSNLKATRAKILQLSKQIQDLQNQEVTLNGQLLAIDQKYESKFIDIDRKISAIKNAKEEVIVSIVDIEAGIKSNLS
jgi:hypothetical protein